MKWATPIGSTIASGLVDGIGLMRRAGQAVAAVILERFPEAAGVAVLAGPGNNGGDGYVIAEELRQAGVAVTLWRVEAPQTGHRRGNRGGRMRACQRAPLAEFAPAKGWLVVDALFGAGLARAPDGVYAEAIARLDAAGARVVAVDLPSGVSGLSGAVLGKRAARRGDRHLLSQEARASASTRPRAIAARLSSPTSAFATTFSRRSARPASRTIRANWLHLLPSPAADTHKYARGHVGVFSGGLASTGAARLAAMAAARAGAGAVTLLSPANALAVNAAHLTSIILKKVESMDDVVEFMDARKPGALVFGPGLGTQAKVGRFALDLMAAAAGLAGAIVFDADGLTVLAGDAR